IQISLFLVAAKSAARTATAGISCTKFAGKRSDEFVGSALRGAQRPSATLFARRVTNSADRDLAADFRAQFVDQSEILLGLYVPEGPSVTGLRALRDLTDGWIEPALVAEHDRAGRKFASQRPM